MKRLLRFWVGALVCLALVGSVIPVLVHEIRFGREAVSTTATVERFTGRKIIRRGGGTAVHEVDGQAVKATFQSWYLYRGPREGDRVPVLYLPTEPGRVAMDSFMQRYGPLVFPLVLAFAVAHWAGIFRRRRKAPIPRRQGEVGKGTAEP